jgi:hypothetical protein
VHTGTLPAVSTHLLQSEGLDPTNPHERAQQNANRTRAVEALKNLQRCTSALPFVMPIRARNRNAQREYDRLVAACLQILLGWVLPRTGPVCTVRVYLEQYGGHSAGDDHTGYFRGMLDGVSQGHPERFARWRLDRVEWQAPEFEYIPYADLLAYLAQEHTPRGRELGSAVELRKWPGYVPLSLDLVPRLLRIEALEAGGQEPDALDLAAELEGTELGHLICEDLRTRSARRPEIGLRLLEALDARYRNPDRNLDALAGQLNAVRRVVPQASTAASPRVRLLFTSLLLQDANHDGDPDRAHELAVQYALVRKELAEHDRELTVFTDLNLAVHLNDRFEFGAAETLLEEMSAR